MWQYQALLRVQSNYNSTLLFPVNQDIQTHLFTQTMPGTKLVLSHESVVRIFFSGGRLLLTPN